MELTPELQKTVDRIGDLPSMPELVAEVLQLSNDPNSDVARIAEVISHDPGLTAKILRVSNSPYYGMRQYVGTLKLAMVILGIREVRNIVLGVSLFDSLRSEKAESILAADFWSHSFMVGALARKLSDQIKINVQGEEFIAGLLHDIGKMVLCRQKGDDYGPIYDKTGGHGVPLCDAEREAFGFTHCDVAAALAEKWNLPKTLVDALWLHHPVDGVPMDGAKDPHLVAVVRIANEAAHMDLLNGDDDRKAALRDDANWAALADARHPLAPDDRVPALVEFTNELSEEPPLSF